ncbi:type II secretion system protein [Granulicella tundricola]|uniref:Putative secretion/fimbrial assembly protein n=1 Tax=Granulicella tundricola (strain ATCC BAA-1859 / DSM 23138 / MP5ACTX9) TaxID=1198114 RepID=E8X285_GRATM|nr:type II secretion system protein [Granulicella tundricola]ADW68017.1 putative secretion/fimbrial assembly protein [Granulicella tundricola MP5ACTX9]
MNRPLNKTKAQGEDGFLLVALVVAIFLILLALSVAAPRVARQLQREREVESAHRANQYVRAIRLYYKKFGNYPASMEALKKSNNIRFLRQEYVDPLTGKSDWRLIRVGTNKTKVKGFFGEDLPGLAGGLGSAANLGSAASSGSGFGSGSAFGSSSGSGSGASGLGGTSGTTGITSGSGTTTGTGTGTGTGSSSGSSFGSNSGFGSASSQDASSLGGSSGPFMGVGSAKTGEAILVVNEQTNYEDWEFLYDPRIEQMYAKSSLLGGVSSGSSSGSLGSLGGSSSAGQGTTGSPTSPTSGFGSPTTPTNPTSPTSPTPQ